MARARAAGQHVGRPRLRQEVVDAARALRAQGKGWGTIAKALGISATSARRACQNALADQDAAQQPPEGP